MKEKFEIDKRDYIFFLIKKKEGLRREEIADEYKEELCLLKINGDKLNLILNKLEQDQYISKTSNNGIILTPDGERFKGYDYKKIDDVNDSRKKSRIDNIPKYGSFFAAVLFGCTTVFFSYQSQKSQDVAKKLTDSISNLHHENAELQKLVGKYLKYQLKIPK